MSDFEPRLQPQLDLIMEFDFPICQERQCVTTPEEIAHIETATDGPHVSAEVLLARTATSQSNYIKLAVDYESEGQPVPLEISRVIEAQDRLQDHLRRAEERREKRDDRDAARLARRMRLERRANHLSAEARWLGTQLVDLFRGQHD